MTEKPCKPCSGAAKRILDNKETFRGYGWNETIQKMFEADEKVPLRDTNGDRELGP